MLPRRADLRQVPEMERGHGTAGRAKARVAAPAPCDAGLAGGVSCARPQEPADPNLADAAMPGADELEKEREEDFDCDSRAMLAQAINAADRARLLAIIRRVRALRKARGQWQGRLLDERDRVRIMISAIEAWQGGKYLQGEKEDE